MNISKLHQHYWTHDGRIKSFCLNIENNTAEIELLVKRITTPGKGRIYEENLVPCTIKLMFQHLIKVSVFNNLPSDGYYLEFSTYDNDNKVELSINVFDNSSYVHEKPNWVIKAKTALWEEI